MVHSLPGFDGDNSACSPYIADTGWALSLYVSSLVSQVDETRSALKALCRSSLVDSGGKGSYAGPRKCMSLTGW